MGPSEFLNSLRVLGISALATVFAIGAVSLLASVLHGWAIAVLCALAMFIPIISLLVLLRLSGGANRELRSHGYQVGFFGVNPRTI